MEQRKNILPLAVSRKLWKRNIARWAKVIMQFLYVRSFDFKTKFLNVCILVASIFNALIEIGIVAIISILISRSLGFVSENILEQHRINYLKQFST